MAQRSSAATQRSTLSAARAAVFLVLVMVRHSGALYLPTTEAAPPALCAPSEPVVTKSTTNLTDVPEAAAQLAITAAAPADVTESTTTETWTDSPELVTASSGVALNITPANAVVPTAVVPTAVMLNIAPPRAVTLTAGVQGGEVAPRPPPLEDPLFEAMLRQSVGAARYASGYASPLAASSSTPQGGPQGGPQGRSLFSRVTPETQAFQPQPDEVPEIRKDVYIHLAADEPAPSTAAPPPTQVPRKHYKIIVIKPPTPAPPVELTTRAVDVETLIYVLVPKADAPPPVTTTPRPPSKHEVFFIRYKTPPASAADQVDAANPDLDIRSASTPGTPTTNPQSEAIGGATVDQSSEASEAHTATAVEDGEEENELDGEVQDQDAVNDLLSVSTDDILRSWRRSDGDLHFDADLKRIARSHSSARIDDEDIDAVHKAVGDAVSEALSVAVVQPRPVSTALRCSEYAAAEALNAALGVEEAGKHVDGSPDFEAVRQGRAHYGQPLGRALGRAARSVAPCAEPFALRDDVAPFSQPIASVGEGRPDNATHAAVTTKTVKFSAKLSSPMGLWL